MKHGTDFLLLFSSSGHAEGANRLLKYTRWNFKLQPEIKLLEVNIHQQEAARVL